MSIEHIALDYLWPHRMNKDIRPIDIMRLPPDDFQGWHIQIEGETMTLTREQETHTFSLKKLIVQIDKERGGMFGQSPATPRELAKMLIHTDVERHYSLESIAHSGSGMGWYGYDVSCGGITSARVGTGGKYTKLKVDCWHILVSEFEGEDGPWIFDLREIYHEIELDLQRGYALVQPTLF